MPEVWYLNKTAVLRQTIHDLALLPPTPRSSGCGHVDANHKIIVSVDKLPFTPELVLSKLKVVDGSLQRFSQRANWREQPPDLS
jgi:hypothetical protein